MKVLFAGGGTGGHTIPGIALAQRVQQDGSQVLFMASNREVDFHLLERYKLSAAYLAVQPPNLNPAMWPRLLVDSVKVYRQAARIIDDFAPDAVVGLGGYVSLLPVLAGRMRRLPILLLEQNVIPGKVTRRLAPLANEVCCQWQETMRYFGVNVHARVTGNPVRAEIMSGSREEAMQQFGLDPAKKTLLVVGGSQAAHSLNVMMIQSADDLARELPAVQVIHLAGQADHDIAAAAYQRAGVQAFVAPFLDQMNLAYRAADFVLGRAGGTTIAELTACGIPALLVPLPHAADDHQRCNARSLAESGAAVVLEQADFTPRIIVGLIRKFFDDDGLARRMHQASLDRGRPGAADEIVAKLKTFVKPSATSVSARIADTSRAAPEPEPVAKEQA